MAAAKIESRDDKLDNVSDNADIVTGYKVIVNWRDTVRTTISITKTFI